MENRETVSCTGNEVFTCADVQGNYRSRIGEKRVVSSLLRSDLLLQTSSCMRSAVRWPTAAAKTIVRAPASVPHLPGRALASFTRTGNPSRRRWTHGQPWCSRILLDDSPRSSARPHPPRRWWGMPEQPASQLPPHPLVATPPRSRELRSPVHPRRYHVLALAADADERRLLVARRGGVRVRLAGVPEERCCMSLMVESAAGEVT